MNKKIPSTSSRWNELKTSRFYETFVKMMIKERSEEYFIFKIYQTNKLGFIILVYVFLIISLDKSKQFPVITQSCAEKRVRQIIIHYATRTLKLKIKTFY